jgi:ATPase subunit of ABC transporter with duplicated ATPase domains
VVTISHNQGFVEQLCNELWRVGGGVVEIELIGSKAAKAEEKKRLDDLRKLKLAETKEGAGK